MCARADRSERVEVQVQVEARGSRHVFFALGLTAAQLSEGEARARRHLLLLSVIRRSRGDELQRRIRVFLQEMSASKRHHG